MGSSSSTSARHRVVIVGGGYAGVRTALDLAKEGKEPLDIVLVSDRDTHLDLTLLYEVGTAYLRHESVISSEQIQESVELPLRDIFSGNAVDIVIKKAERIDVQGQVVVLADDSTIDYDTLVIGVGSSLATFNVPGVGTDTFSIKTLPDALQLRHHIVRQFYQAADLTDQARASALTFVVAGGGASGVEVAAELMGQVQRQCHQHGVAPDDISVILLEAGERILGILPEEVAGRAQRRLESLGVDVRVKTRITEVTPSEVRLQGGEYIYSRTTVWTAGLRPNQLLVDSGLSIDEWGVLTEETLQAQGIPNVFVIGDAAIIPDISPPLPATVPVAYGQGAVAARNIVRQRRGQSLEKFTYTSPGMVITLGGKTALALFPSGKHLFGWLPWLVKHFITLRYWMRLTSWGNALRLWYRGWHIHGAND